jgi:SAM-dependent methyltransferase
MKRYVLRGGRAGAERLRLLSRVTWPTTESVLRAAGLCQGLRCLDAGCGVGAVTLEMARQVGPHGQAVGIDVDEPALELARQEARRQRLPAVFRPGNLLDLAEDSAYDFTYARFLLSHLPGPGSAVERLERATRPGGVVVLEDVDFAGHFCHPASPAFDRYVALYRESVRREGADACLGPRLPDLLEGAGLTGVELGVMLPTFRRGEGKRMAAVTLEHIREAVLAAGLITAPELDATVAELEHFARDPRSIISLPRIFQVWGRKPPTSS